MKSWKPKFSILTEIDQNKNILAEGSVYSTLSLFIPLGVLKACYATGSFSFYLFQPFFGCIKFFLQSTVAMALRSIVWKSWKMIPISKILYNNMHSTFSCH